LTFSTNFACSVFLLKFKVMHYLALARL